MKAIVALVIVAAACKTTPPPSSPYVGVYQELVDAGCLAPGDASLTGVEAAYQQAVASPDAAPGWFTCLVDGGRPLACGVPCTVGP
jgi:hypothetical protein